MPHYQVGKLWFFKELGTKPPVGSTVELDEEVANRYMHNEPGLLRPARITTQAHPTTARSSEKKAEETQRQAKNASNKKRISRKR